MRSSRWRTTAYALLTQTILLLGRLRERVVRYEPHRRHAGRVFCVYQEERCSCCDCGLVHDMTLTPKEAARCDHAHPAGPLQVAGHCWPLRPAAYRYRPRAGAQPPALSRPKSGEGG